MKKYNKPKITLEEVTETLKSKVSVNPYNQCWEWKNKLGKSGHGFINGRARTFLGEKTAHRASYVIFKGPIPNNMVVRHQCNNAKCCNPEHLILGTQRENMADKYQTINDMTIAALKNYREQLLKSISKIDEELAKRA